ncbi:MAG: hypothetical protein HQL51_11785 [Magnetococcales bacterium]|nr:hypothetical protein [Magnetococcales bacterium]
MPTVEELHARWQAVEEPRERDKLVARALGEKNGKGKTPHYVSDLLEAQRAMDKAWRAMEEAAPARIVCQVARGTGRKERHCHVEWWPDDGSHVATPTFASEAESRAFAAFVFASLQASEG